MATLPFGDQLFQSQDGEEEIIPMVLGSSMAALDEEAKSRCNEKGAGRCDATELPLVPVA